MFAFQKATCVNTTPRDFFALNQNGCGFLALCRARSLPRWPSLVISPRPACHLCGTGDCVGHVGLPDTTLGAKD